MSDVVVGGTGFSSQMMVVFTVRQDGVLMNATSRTSSLGAGRLRAHVPQNAVSGPIYVLNPLGVRSNHLRLSVRSAAPACQSVPGPGDAVMRWVPVIACDLTLLHQPPTDAIISDVLIIIQNESGGNPLAENGWDINAQHGDPSRGLMQTIGATFNAYRSAQLLDNIFDPAANIYAGLNYGISRYGSIPNIPGVKSVNAGHGYKPYKTSAGHA